MEIGESVRISGENDECQRNTMENVIEIQWRVLRVLLCTLSYSSGSFPVFLHRFHCVPQILSNR